MLDILILLAVAPNSGLFSCAVSLALALALALDLAVTLVLALSQELIALPPTLLLDQGHDLP